MEQSSLQKASKYNNKGIVGLTPVAYLLKLFRANLQTLVS
jgi:hypothetical protein